MDAYIHIIKNNGEKQTNKQRQQKNTFIFHIISLQKKVNIAV